MSSWTYTSSHSASSGRWTNPFDILVDKHALRAALLGKVFATQPCSKRGVGGPQGTLRLTTDAYLKRCGGEVCLIVPAGSQAQVPGRTVPSLVKAIARARAWYERLVRGEVVGVRQIAKLEGRDERYVSRFLDCAFLAPDLVEMTLDGRQPAGLTLARIQTRVPLDWRVQRRLLTAT